MAREAIASLIVMPLLARAKADGLRVTAETYPHLAEVVAGQLLAPGYDPDTEFAFGLDLFLDALQPDEL